MGGHELLIASRIQARATVAFGQKHMRQTGKVSTQDPLCDGSFTVSRPEDEASSFLVSTVRKSMRSADPKGVVEVTT